MAFSNPRHGFAHRSYETIQPNSQWVREETSQTLLLDLPGFKKEQIRVQLDGYGNLKVSGERPLTVAGNRWCRFRKDFRVPENSSTDEIRAKFEDGLLYVIIPKVITFDIPTPVPPPDRQEASKEEKKSDVDRKEEEEESHGMRSSPEKAHLPAADEPALSGKEDIDQYDEKFEYGGGNLGMGLDDGRKKLLINVVVAVLVLVGLGLYFGWGLRKSRPAAAAMFKGGNFSGM